MKPAVNAVILAGGLSRRMGTDKAGMLHPVSGKPLLSHQLAHIADLPLNGVFVSAREEQELPAFSTNIMRINDTGEHGPLGGIAAALHHAPSHHLLVIPVDLPLLTADVLFRMIACIPSLDCGIVAKSPQSLEPLVAIFPPQALPAMATAIQLRNLSVKALIQGPLQAMMESVEFADPTPFRNWNSPADI